MRGFLAADVVFAALLLLLLTLGNLRGVVAVGEGSGFVLRSEVAEPSARDVLPRPTNGHVNPNRADAKALALLPGIGSRLAEAIVRYRETHGPFRRLVDLERVPDIGAGRLHRMLPYLTLDEGVTWSTR
ncbi:MAG: helix-hairpin-helix domain-containing protein [candidate division NC10 bacterium]|nr:helix-hairpin-helix domain-containing protein [candidate division NC10 bacterium]